MNDENKVGIIGILCGTFTLCFICVKLCSCTVEDDKIKYPNGWEPPPRVITNTIIVPTYYNVVTNDCKKAGQP